jgi:hypothetical protein
VGCCGGVGGGGFGVVGGGGGWCGLGVLSWGFCWVLGGLWVVLWVWCVVGFVWGGCWLGVGIVVCVSLGVWCGCLYCWFLVVGWVVFVENFYFCVFLV